jgi:hypothetical protein
MEWQNVELIDINKDGGNTRPEPLIAGLEAAPEDLHNAFLSDLPHLSEVRDGHQAILSLSSDAPESHHSMLMSLQAAEITVADLGGHREGDALVIPLSGAIQDCVKLEIFQHQEGVALRLNVEADDKTGFNRTFRLPPGSELAQAGWRGQSLVLSLKKSD